MSAARGSFSMRPTRRPPRRHWHRCSHEPDQKGRRILAASREHGRAPKADMRTRLALVVAERRLTEKQLSKFYKTGRGRGKAKKYFDYFLFAEKQQISIDWLLDGVLSLHPRIPAAREKQRPRPLADGGAA